jgi:hexosaminidase
MRPVAEQLSTIQTIVPAPVSVSPTGEAFSITVDTRIHATGEAARTAGLLAGFLRPATGFPLPVATEPGDITLQLVTAAELGPEGYHLEVTPTGVSLRANEPAGLGNAVQTLRQLLPHTVESTTRQPGPWLLPGGRIVDHPRFAYRGAMLDVARHFFPVPDVCRFVDHLARYKINHLHLHLTDDQGWRIAINSRPNLTAHGASTQVGGGPGGHYTQDDYREIVAYAADRNITVVPEIDAPGHTNAALSSYPELNPDNQAPDPYTGIDVGFSSLDANNETTYEFLTDVIAEISGLTPGPYLHIGGDEAQSTTDRDYQTFADRIAPIVAGHGKTMVSWHELAKAHPDPATVLQYWGTAKTEPEVVAGVVSAVNRGNRVILSPGDRTYLDQKYDENTEIGLEWAAHIETEDAYSWNPAAYLPEIPESAILGIEAPLWSETTSTMADLEFLAFPRLPAIAELAWSPAETHNWSAFRTRLATHGPRWTTAGIKYYPSPQIAWPTH